MRNSKKHTKKRIKKINPIFVIVLGIALMLGGSWSYQLLQLDRSIEQQKAELESKKLQIIAQNGQLHEEIEKLNTPSYVEQLAREKLGLVRKGEILIAPKESEN
ncbi:MULTISPECIES: septum formation initiator family protein [Dehalobacter]|jgi:cell division protein DivIC|nr:MULTISPECIES: septum formation initiator family protein [Dehalobacter]MCG1025713.1 septum formation initiator family protein [Dehalobacter sp.]MDJ0305473.1 septum formation initiator family protein [Dehalobacter sp.]QGZ99386.1 septum formation initiator family protein [Dehalobacter restrictus]